jgi:DNA-binding transcriptional ArsR family regulator
MANKPNYYGILPSQVRYDKELSNFTKLMYCEVSALSSKDGKCFASNGYFAKIYGVSEKTVSRAIISLRDNGYIKITHYRKKDDYKISKREITLRSKMSVKMDKNVPYNTIKIIDNNIMLDKNVSKGKFEVLSGIAINFYKAQEKDFTTLMPKWDNSNYINKSVNILYKIIMTDDYHLQDVSDALDWGVADDFWKPKLLTLTTLRTVSKNGNTKFTNLYIAWQGSVKPKTFQGGIIK